MVKKVDEPFKEKSLKALLAHGPVMSASQFQSYLKTRKKFEVWKRKPVAISCS
jgi:hypothetical protein